MDQSLAGSVAETMQALAAPTRLLILSRLARQPWSVNELAAELEMQPSAISHQLRVLRHLGFVVGSRDGRRVFYELHDEHVGQLVQEAIAHGEHRQLGIEGYAKARTPARARS